LDENLIFNVDTLLAKGLDIVTSRKKIIEDNSKKETKLLE